MTKYEVKVVDLGVIANSGAHEAILNSLSSQGWQLVAISNLVTSARAYLQRPIGKE